MDTASPTVSVAVGRGGTCLAARSVELRRSSEALLRLVDEALEEAGLTLRDLDGIVALRGPGSFTGLRVGLATALGLHQALGTPATAVPTLEVLAVAARAVHPEIDGSVAAVVDALRGQWFTRFFTRADALPTTGSERAGDQAAILDPAEVAARRPTLLVGHGAERLAADPAWEAGLSTETDSSQPLVLDLATPDESGPSLAEAALLHHAGHGASGRGDKTGGIGAPWDAATLTHPLYLRAPAVTLPKRSMAGAVRAPGRDR